MSSSQTRYITTTLPYVNSAPHIGFAAELLRADTLARYYRLLGYQVFLNTGTDEHGQKIFEKAEAAGVPAQQFVDELALEFKRLLPALDIIPEVNFVRTTDPHHKLAAQELWRRCRDNGDIYKAKHQVKYCKGCELEKTESELVNGQCPLHPTYQIEVRDEENYFFRFSKYQQPLLDLYEAMPDFVVPDFRLAEIKKFVASGLQDFSVSRLRSKMSWGVPVPDDDEQVMYVWFDALTNYISVTGWPEQADFAGWWPGLQFAGKDNLRQQSAIWQAMLLSADLPTSQQIYIGGFITSGGQKMSKSLGNVISPFAMAERYGVDATRYILLRHVHPFDDSDVTWEKMDEWYTANLVNGLGNLTARIMKMCEAHLEPEYFPPLDPTTLDAPDMLNFQQAMDHIWHLVGQADERITQTEPFRLIKTDSEAAKVILRELRADLLHIGRLLLPAMPETSVAIRQAVRANQKPVNLFTRLPE